MAERRDYVALEWLAGEIRQSLQLCRENLGAYRYAPDKSELLSATCEALHQVQGSLRMIEFSGAALLVAEMEQAIAELDAARQPPARSAEWLGVIDGLCQALPEYLDDIGRLRCELPVELMRMFNELRAARGQVMLSSTVLFLPSLTVAPATTESAALAATTREELADKLRQMYQLALKNYLDGEQRDKSLSYLGKVCARAAKLSAGSAWQNFWLAAAALLEALTSGELTASVATTACLNRLDRELRKFAEGVQTAPSPSLFRDILFYVALVADGSPAVREVRERHRLADNFAAPENQWRLLSEPAVAAIVAELRRLAERLNEGGAPVEVRARSKDLSDAVAVLGLIRSLYSVGAAVDTLREVPSEAQIHAVAKAFESVAVELAQEESWVNEKPVGTPPGPDYLQLRRSLALQSGEVLNDAQEAIMSFVASDWQVDYLLPIPSRLQELAEALDGAELGQAAAVVNSCGRYIFEQLIEAGKQPGWQELDGLADAMTSIDYFLERSISGSRPEDSALLELAQRCVMNLGYGSTSDTAPGDAPVQTPVPADVLSFSPAEALPSGGAVAEQDAETETVLDLDPDILDVFVEEAGEVVDLLRERLPRWRQAILSRELLAEVRRAFHTLKGSGRMIGAEQCGELGWAVENMLNKVVEERFAMDDARLGVVEQATALLPEMIDELQKSRILPPERLATVLANAEALSREQSPTLLEVVAGEAAKGSADEGLIAVFIGEADVHLTVIEDYLDNVVSYPVRLSDEVQRSLHTLKGSSKMAEVWAIANVITPLEGLIKELRALRVPADQELIGLISAVVVETRKLITRLNHNPPTSLETPEALRQRIESMAARLLSEPAHERSASQLEPGELEQFLMVYGDQVQKLTDAIDRAGDRLSASLFRNAAAAMGQFAIRAEEIGSESTAEMAQALQVMFSRTRDPLPDNYAGLVSRALDQLMDELNQLAAEQTAAGDEQLLDQIRDYESKSVDTPAASGSAPLQAAPPELAAGPQQMLVDDEADPDILEIFLEEARDLLDSLDEALHDWSADRGNSRYTDDILRYLHTLKGGARLSGLSALGDLAHNFESLVSSAVVKGHADPVELMNEVHRYQDQLVRYIDAVAAGNNPSVASLFADMPAALVEQPVPPEAVVADEAEVVARLEVAPTPVVAAPPAVPPAVPVAEPIEDDGAAAMLANRGPQEMIKVPAGLLEGLINLAGESSITRGRVEEQVNDVHYSLDEMEMTVLRLQEQVRRLDMETEAQILFRQEQMESEGAEGFDPLEFDRYSQLQQSSRALLESASDLIDLRNTVVDKNRDIETLLGQQARVNTELQEGLMRSQMVHFSRMVPRLRRGVRQVAGELGKEVEFKVFNAEGEMDRRVLERIIPALEHVLRNAIDHGIEDAAARRASGKPAGGLVSMRFDRQGGDVVILIGDDGSGINLGAVRRKAESLGLLTADAELSEAQLLDYIFHAGFSTASNITQISGRGVGMDVVRNEIKQLGGAISVQTRAGRGTEFEIRLPFTVSVNRALMVSVSGEVYAVPLNNIEGIVRVSPYELEVYYEPGGPAYEYAGQSYKLRYMGQLLGSGKPLLEGQVEPRPVLLMRNADPATAIQVDSLLGSREIVVKTLGPQFAAVPGLSGATVLGDGSIVVILDLLASIRANEARLLLHDDSAHELALQEPNMRRVMVVDDSVTVRKVTSRLLERQKMQVVLARDGLEAIQLLQDMETLPDVILLDIEMPRMDGFEVASRMRSNPRLRDIPVIMISSRTGQKHRQRAQGLGVQRFLGKPYQEIQLLKSIDEVIASADVT